MADEILELNRKIDLLICQMNSIFFEIGDLRDSQYSKKDIVHDLNILKDSLFDSFEKMNDVYLKYYDERLRKISKTKSIFY